ncbi:hypothetical protein ABK040_003896 [Willaertia magna]
MLKRGLLSSIFAKQQTIRSVSLSHLLSLSSTSTFYNKIINPFGIVKHFTTQNNNEINNEIKEIEENKNDSLFLYKFNSFHQELTKTDPNLPNIKDIFKQVHFKSSYSLDNIPPLSKYEIAIIGRSNVGKSTLIKSLINGKREKSTTVKTSKTPGRTQTLNFFEVKSLSLNIVDMPGYGYAKVPSSLLRKLHVLIRSYFIQRMNENVKKNTFNKFLMTFWLLDIRRIREYVDTIKKNKNIGKKLASLGLKASDKEFLQFLIRNNIPFQIVLTKADHYSVNHVSELVLHLKELLMKELNSKDIKLGIHSISPNICFTSGKTGRGILQIKKFITQLVVNAHKERGENLPKIVEESKEEEQHSVLKEDIIKEEVSLKKEEKKKVRKEEEEEKKTDEEKEEILKEEEEEKEKKKKKVKQQKKVIPSLGVLSKQNKFIQRTKYLDDKVNRDSKQSQAYERIFKYKFNKQKKKK